MLPVVASATQDYIIMERVSIFIDGANFYHGIKSIDRRYSDFKFDFLRYIKKITRGRKLIDVYYFNAPLKQQLNPKIYSKQQKFFLRLISYGWKVIICKRKKRFLDDGTEKHVIKEDDIRLALQMQKDAYENKYDTAIIFSGDGDFAPLPEFLSQKGKKVENHHFEKSISSELISKCSGSFAITKKIVKKFFYREKIVQKSLDEGLN